MLFTIRLVLKPLSVCVRVLPLIQRYTRTRACVCGCVGVRLSVGPCVFVFMCVNNLKLTSAF